MSTAGPPLTALCIILAGACAPYSAGSFRTSGGAFPDGRTSVGCVDVGMRASLDPAAEGPVIDLFLGNRCSEAVWIDVPSLDISAYLEDGEEVPVDFYDPRDEIKVALLGGKELMVERLELVAPLDSVRLCVRMDRLANSARKGPPPVICTAVEGGA